MTMLTRKRQQDYFRQRWELILPEIGQFAGRTSARNIHQFRVNIKKIRALLWLHEKTGRKVKRAEKNIIKKIFRQAGKVRDAQVSAQLIKAAGAGTRQFFTERREAVARESKTFVKLFSRNADVLMKQNRRILKSFKNISKQELEKTIRHLLQNIRKTYVPDLRLSEVHASRKNIKRIVYIMSMLNKKDAVIMKLDVSQLKSLEENVGKWHDAVITKKLLKKLAAGSAKQNKVIAITKNRLQKVKKAAKSVF